MAKKKKATNKINDYDPNREAFDRMTPPDKEIFLQMNRFLNNISNGNYGQVLNSFKNSPPLAEIITASLDILKCHIILNSIVDIPRNKCFYFGLDPIAVYLTIGISDEEEGITLDLKLFLLYLINIIRTSLDWETKSSGKNLAQTTETFEKLFTNQHEIFEKYSSHAEIRKEFIDALYKIRVSFFKSLYDIKEINSNQPETELPDNTAPQVTTPPQGGKPKTRVSNEIKEAILKIIEKSKKGIAQSDLISELEKKGLFKDKYKDVAPANAQSQTRSAVSNAVKELRYNGYEISRSPYKIISKPQQ